MIDFLEENRSLSIYLSVWLSVFEVSNPVKKNTLNDLILHKYQVGYNNNSLQNTQQ